MDIDYFVFTAPSSGTYDFSIAYNISQYKLSLALLDKYGDDIIGVNGTTGKTQFSKYLTKGEKYYLEVMGTSFTRGQPLPYSVYVYLQ